jgi:hypothetical protein
MIRANPDDPLFFEYVWPPTLADLADPDPIYDWDAGLVGYGVDDIRDIKRRVPLIELSNKLEQAKKQAAEIWRNRTGLDQIQDRQRAMQSGIPVADASSATVYRVTTRITAGAVVTITFRLKPTLPTYGELSNHPAYGTR